MPTGTLNHFARRVGVADAEAVRAALREGIRLRPPVEIELAPHGLRVLRPRLQAGHTKP